LLGLGEVARRQGDYTRAQALLQEGLEVAVEAGFVFRIVAGLEALAALASAEKRWEHAAHLLGASERLRRDTGFAIFDDPTSYEQTVDAVRTQLGSESFEREWDNGGAMSVETVIGLARGESPAPK
jgi:hypothetical protein